MPELVAPLETLTFGFEDGQVRTGFRLSVLGKIGRARRRRLDQSLLEPEQFPINSDPMPGVIHMCRAGILAFEEAIGIAYLDKVAVFLVGGHHR